MERALIVVAHPDDEVLGAGIWMHRRGGLECHVLHLTDGSPRDLTAARAAGFQTRDEYAHARRRELSAALRLAGVPGGNCHRAGVVDQEAYLHLNDLIGVANRLIVELRPSIVLTSAYEGGHPDHDSAAFIVSAVQRREPTFELLEFPLYHASPTGEMITGTFIQERGCGGAEVARLSGAERDLKREMLGCFESQSEVLKLFGVERETFRVFGGYDFTQTPHPGELLYERWGWGISGSAWRAKAREAMSGLD